jgi:LPXTG-site transpeptidase (sortase) family protein
MGTAEVSYSSDKLPSGNTLDASTTISIPKINLSQSIYLPQYIGDDLVVGHHEVLRASVLGNNVFYGHNGTDVFGSIYQLNSGDVVNVSTNGQLSKYVVDAKLFVHKSDVKSLNSNSNQISLVTCSYTEPDYRIIVKASIQK